MLLRSFVENHFTVQNVIQNFEVISAESRTFSRSNNFASFKKGEDRYFFKARTRMFQVFLIKIF